MLYFDEKKSDLTGRL